MFPNFYKLLRPDFKDFKLYLTTNKKRLFLKEILNGFKAKFTINFKNRCLGFKSLFFIL